MVEITVVIPLYNKEKEIRRALQSVKDQTVSPKEVIVVDDGSTDGGAGVVRGFQLQNLRLVQQENGGECAARNRGICEARGELIAFLDADDSWEPDFLRAIVTMRERYPQCGMYVTAIRQCDAKGCYCYPSVPGLPPPGKDGILSRYFFSAAHGACASASSVAIPRDILIKVHGFPNGVKLGGDRVTWLKIAVRYPVAFCNRYLATWHLDASNRVSRLYSPDLCHPVVEEGLRALAKQELPTALKRDLRYFIGRTQVYFAKQLIRANRSKDARTVLRECVTPWRMTFKWGVLMLCAYLPTKVVVRAVSLYYALLNGVRSNETQHSTP